MDTLFLELLIHVGSQGEVTQANMYQGGELSTITIVKDGETYEYTISKKDEVKQ